MDTPNYLEGANSYPPEISNEYVARGWWQNLTYGDILDRSAASYPDNVAVIDERTRLTYAQLKEKVDRFAIALLELGVKKYDRVLIQLPNRHECITAHFAVQKIGAVSIFAVSRHAYREVSYLFKLTEPVGWIIPLWDGSRDFLPLINQIRSEVEILRYLIMLEDGGALPSGALSMGKLIASIKMSGYPDDYLGQFRPGPNDVALILPTGGTTGLPKGVPRTSNSYFVATSYGFKDTGPQDVVGLATPIGHSLAQQGPVAGSVMKGATLAIIAIPRAKEIMQAVQKNNITILPLVPTQLEDILNDPDLDKYDLSSLRRIQTFGSPLRPETAQKVRELFGTKSSGSCFGSTEGPSTVHLSDETPEVFSKSVGKVLCEGDNWKVIDDQERELSLNTEGELAVKGPSIFTGYYRAEAENKEAFTRDGYFKTGDLGKIDEEGYIYITGRKKDIIQRGGEGIIPSEIESLLHIHPDIEVASVVAMPDPRLGEKACAYVVLKPGKTLSFDELISFLKGLGAGKLLLPERLEVVDELPKTSVGKVDKKKLRQDITSKLILEE